MSNSCIFLLLMKRLVNVLYLFKVITHPNQHLTEAFIKISPSKHIFLTFAFQIFFLFSFFFTFLKICFFQCPFLIYSYQNFFNKCFLRFFFQKSFLNFFKFFFKYFFPIYFLYFFIFFCNFLFCKIF